jgi:hypothetical protein
MDQIENYNNLTISYTLNFPKKKKKYVYKFYIYKIRLHKIKIKYAFIKVFEDFIS